MFGNSDDDLTRDRLSVGTSVDVVDGARLTSQTAPQPPDVWIPAKTLVVGVGAVECCEYFVHNSA